MANRKPLFTEYRKAIIAWKKQLNPSTGSPYTYEEIAPLVGLKSAQSAKHYTVQIRGCCPGCLRPLETGEKPARLPA